MNIMGKLKSFTRRVNHAGQDFNRLAQQINQQTSQQQTTFNQVTQAATRDVNGLNADLNASEKSLNLAQRRRNRWLIPAMVASTVIPSIILLNGHLRLSDARKQHKAEVTGTMDSINSRLAALNGVPRPRMLTESQYSTLLTSPSEQLEYLNATLPEEQQKLIAEQDRRRLFLLDDQAFRRAIALEANADLRPKQSEIDAIRQQVRPIVVTPDEDPALNYVERPWIQRNIDLPSLLYRKASDRVVGIKQ